MTHRNLASRDKEGEGCACSTPTNPLAHHCSSTKRDKRSKLWDHQTHIHSLHCQSGSVLRPPARRSFISHIISHIISHVISHIRFVTRQGVVSPTFCHLLYRQSRKPNPPPPPPSQHHFSPDYQRHQVLALPLYWMPAH